MTTLNRWLLRLALAALLLCTVVPIVTFEVLYRVNLARASPLPTPPARARLPSPLREALIATGELCPQSTAFPWPALLKTTWWMLGGARGRQGPACIENQVAYAHAVQRVPPSTRPLGRLPIELALATWLRRNWEPEQVLSKFAESASYGTHEGKRLEGNEPAARELFGASADSLTPAQAATIAALANNPAHSPWRHPERALFRRQWILHRMREAGALDDAQLATALAAPLGVQGAVEPATPAAKPGSPDDPE
jgi:membrane peptidoglycan carboxypeptidase